MEEPNGRKSVLIFSHFVYINPTYSNNSMKIVYNKLRYRFTKTITKFIINTNTDDS